MKSVVILEQKNRLCSGLTYYGLQLGCAFLWLAARLLLGFRRGPEFDQFALEQLGAIQFVYDARSERDHLIQPRLLALFYPSVWLRPAVQGIVCSGIYLAYRLAVGFALAGQMHPEDAVAAALIGALFFTISLGLQMWWSVRRDLAKQVLAERENVAEGTMIKYVHLTEWPAFQVDHLARSL